jgi:hypothetical protein
LNHHPQLTKFVTEWRNSFDIQAGGLVSYDASLDKLLRRTGYYVKKLLDGPDPSNSPIEQWCAQFSTRRFKLAASAVHFRP